MEKIERNYYSVFIEKFSDLDYEKHEFEKINNLKEIFLNLNFTYEERFSLFIFIFVIFNMLILANKKR